MVIEQTKTDRCPRCNGRILFDAGSGDSACFNCGHVIYVHEPLPLRVKGKVERRPSHAGTNLA